MRVPLCICNGVIRSGSTWSFNVCRELYQHAAIKSTQKFSSNYVDSAWLEQFVAQPWAGISALTVFKTHDLGPAAMKAIRNGRAKAVCTIRDPRDCVASDMPFSACPFEICIKRISGTVEPLRIYQSTPNTLMVRYEEMMSNRPREIRRIAAHLGVPVDDLTVELIDSKTNIHSSKKLCQSLKDRPDNQILQISNHRIDPQTHLHHNHINGGAIGRWKREFTPDQITFINEYFAPWLLKLGYETSESLAAIIPDSGIESDWMLPSLLYQGAMPSDVMAAG